MNLATLDDDKLQMNPTAMSRNLCTLNKNQSKYPRMIQHQFLVVIQVNLRALGVSKTQVSLRTMIRNPNAMSRNLCTPDKNQSKYPRMVQHQFLVVIQVNLRPLGVSKTQMLRSMIRNLCAMNQDQPTHPRMTRQAAVLVTSSAGPVGMAGSAWMLRHQIRNWCPLQIQRLPHRAQHLHRTRS